MYTPVGKNAHPAHSTEIDLYHVDAGFFVRFVFSEIILCAQSEILSLFEIASVSRTTVSGRSAAVDTAFDLNEQNVSFIFANDIGLQMTAPIIPMQDRIPLGKKISAGEILSRSAHLKISHFSLYQQTKESFFCARGKVRSR